ncbi:MAG: MFS transporter [candidate division KSB1 bacterium]|nr:MFS transporter [candidate division KSB1 bacterium]
MQLIVSVKKWRKELTRQLDWRHTFRGLRYPNFRLWFWGQLISLFGTWMQITAQGYLVFELTHSPAFLGYVGFVSGMPAWLFMLLGGVLADRMSRRKLLLITQSTMMVLSLVLALLTFSQLVRPWHIILLAFGMGIANAFDAPARHVIVSEMVAVEDLTNAIALNATIFNSATAVGPAISGITYAAFGPGWCFTINSISFLAVIIALLKMKVPATPALRPNHSTQIALRQGLRYIIGAPIIRTIIGLIAIASLFAVSFVTLIPAWAVRILGGDETTNGLLQSARGIGALLSALFIASLGQFRFKGKLLMAGALIFPILLLMLSLVRWLSLSLLLLIGIGFAMILVMNLSNSLVQSLVPNELRGRVMSVYSLTFFGLTPFGALWTGAVAERFGEPTALILGAMVSLVCVVAVWFWMPQLRRLE